MPEIISCPDCDRKLRVPDDLLGRKVKCPGCGITFTAGADGNAPSPRKPARTSGIADPGRSGPQKSLRDRLDAEEARGRRRRDDYAEEDNLPRSRRRRDEEDEDYPRARYEEDEDYDDRGRGSSPREGWKKVRLGLTLAIVSIWVSIGSALLGFVGSMLIFGIGFIAMSSARTGGSAAGTATNMGLGVMLLFGLLTLLGLAAKGLDLTGKGFCMAVPPKRDSGLRGLAIATFACAATAVVFELLGMLITFISYGMAFANPMVLSFGMGLTNPIMSIISGLAGLAAFILWIFFLRAVCLTLKNSQLARQLVTFLISLGVYVVVAIMVACIATLLVGVAVTSVVGGATSRSAAAASSASATAGASGILLYGLMCILGLVGLGLFIWYFVMLHQVRGVVDRSLRKRPA